MDALARAVPRQGRPLALAAFYGFLLLGWNAVLFSSLIRDIEGTFHRTDTAFGFLYLMMAILFATGAFSGGFLTERIGRRKVLLVGTVVAGMGSLVAGLTSAWVIFVIAAAALSLGGAVLDAGINGLALDLFPQARGAALNLLHLFFGLGALIGPLVIGTVVSSGVRWQAFMVVTAVLYGVLVAPLAISSMASGRIEKPEGKRQATGGFRTGPFLWMAIAITLYAAVEVGISNWLVRLLAAQTLIAATATLSLFWGGLATGRLLSAAFAERFEYERFTAGCFLLASAALFGAVLAPWPVSVPLYTLAGLFYGPIYPTIMAIGGRVYPDRVAALSGNLTTAAEAGIIVYPPLMGLMAGSIGLKVGMLGAALLGLPGAIAVLAVRRAARERARDPSGTSEASV